MLGVLFSAPLAFTDPSGKVQPMETLGLDRERALICDSMREARRAIRVRFDFATTDRLRTLVTLGSCCGLHYSGHGDPNFLSMEDGRGGAHILLDSASFPNLCSRIHAKVTVSDGEAELHCLGQNHCRVDGKDLAPGQ